ncbi:MAG: AsnC family transcriptional regulator [Candidatus Micrarchaeales archaeon]|nr:AsnC family transcriptional regulator [Candidatus Micrarchaeales archaeon]
MESKENAFNKRYGLVTRKIVRMLSEDSRISVTKIASTLGLSRRAVVRRLKKIEEEFSIRYTLDIDVAKLGLDAPHIVVAKFRKRPFRKELEQILSESYIPQIVIGSHGLSNLVIYANAFTHGEYIAWDRETRRNLAKFGVEWSQSEIAYTRLGFLPLQSKTIKMAAIPDEFKKFLVLLNEDSRIRLREIAKKRRIGYKRTVYIYKKLLEAGYIKRFTISMALPKELSLLAMMSRYIPLQNYNKATAMSQRLLIGERETELINRYIFSCGLMGSYDFFAMGVFDDFRSAHMQGVVAYKKLFKDFKTLELRYMELKEIVSGRLPIRSVDVKKDYVSLLQQRMER